MARLDQSPYLFHFINGYDECPHETLRKILEQKQLISTKGFMEVLHSCRDKLVYLQKSHVITATSRKDEHRIYRYPSQRIYRES